MTIGDSSPVVLVAWFGASYCLVIEESCKVYQSMDTIVSILQAHAIHATIKARGLL